MSLAAAQISQIGAVVVSPGGSWWPAAIVAGSAQIWDSPGGEQRRRLGESGTVPGAVTAPDGSRAARVTKPPAAGRRPAVDSIGA